MSTGTAERPATGARTARPKKVVHLFDVKAAGFALAHGLQARALCGFWQWLAPEDASSRGTLGSGERDCKNCERIRESRGLRLG